MTKDATKSLVITAEILGLSDVVVEDVKIDLAARKITIQVRSTKEEVLCRICINPPIPTAEGGLYNYGTYQFWGKKRPLK